VTHLIVCITRENPEYFICEVEMKHRKGLLSGIAIVASIAMAAGLSGCSGGEGDAEAELEDSYTYATDTSFVPFEFKESGEYTGFDIDLITPRVKTGSFDLAVAVISITDERKEAIDLSDPYYKSGLIVGVPTDHDYIKGVEDLDGKTVATRLGSTSAAYIEDNIEGAE